MTAQAVLAFLLLSFFRIISGNELTNMSSSLSSVHVLATFAAPTFVENLAVRQDNSILITLYDTGKLYLIPPATQQYGNHDVELIFTFPTSCLGIVELDKDIFYISVSNGFESGSSSLWRLDMNGYRGGSASAVPVKIVDIPEPSLQLNGACVLSKEHKILLLADSWAGVIWRVDLGGVTPVVSIWLDRSELKRVIDGERDTWGGVNGLKFNERDKHLYFTSTGQELFCRIAVDVNGAWVPKGDILVVRNKLLGDDFILDEEKRLAYITTHPFNTIERLSLDGTSEDTVLGKPVDDRLLGPTALQWGRQKGQKHRVLIATSTGGIVAPVNGEVKDATVLSIELGRAY